MDDKCSSIFLKEKINIYLWKLCSQELAEEDCVIVLVGNKIDLCNDDEQRPVKYKDGAKLADVNLIDFLFYGTYFCLCIGISLLIF